MRFYYHLLIDETGFHLTTTGIAVTPSSFVNNSMIQKQVFEALGSCKIIRITSLIPISSPIADSILESCRHRKKLVWAFTISNNIYYTHPLQALSLAKPARNLLLVAFFILTLAWGLLSYHLSATEHLLDQSLSKLRQTQQTITSRIDQHRQLATEHWDTLFMLLSSISALPIHLHAISILPTKKLHIIAVIQADNLPEFSKQLISLQQQFSLDGTSQYSSSSGTDIIWSLDAIYH